MSLALARKYRPKSFADVAVQSHVSNTLRGAIARGRVAHGYLLCGPRGVGKTTLARVLAMALNCERRLEAAKQLAPGEMLPPEAGEPCGECQSCRRIWSGAASLDVVEADAASMRDGLSLTDQVLAMGDGGVTVQRVRESLGLIAEDEFIGILDLIAERRAVDVFGVVARLAEGGVDFGGLLTGLGDVLRAQLGVVLGGTAVEVSERMREALAER